MSWKVSRSPGQGFTLIEIMVVVCIIGIIIAIAGSTWIRQRTLSQARSCQENLSKIDSVKEQWALEQKMDDSATPQWTDLVYADGTGYLRAQPICPALGLYTIGSISDKATCTVVAPIDHNSSP